MTLNGQAYFLKRHEGVGWKEIAKNWLVAKRPVLGAENEWRACLRLAAHGIAAPKVAAFARQGGNPARRRSFVLCEELAGFVSLEAVAKEWAAKPPGTKAKRRLVQAAAELVRGLHAAGVAHRDLYICHLLLHRRKWAQGVPRLAVLDLHRARLHKTHAGVLAQAGSGCPVVLHADFGSFRICPAAFPAYLRRASTARGVQGAPPLLARRGASRCGAAPQGATQTSQSGGGRRRPPTARCSCARRGYGHGMTGGGGDDGFALPQCIRWGDEGIDLVRTLRVLPGRRITAVGNFRGREVVVKLFFGPGAKRYWRRERRGVRWLASTGVATPRLLGERPAPEFGGWALLFECLPGARPIAFKAPPAENDSDADGAIELLARLHQHGLTQADSHLGNFIRSDGDGGTQGRLHVIDGGAVGRMSRTSRRAGLKALAAFLAQYPPAADGWAARRLACYERARQWDARSARLGLLRRWLAAERRRRMRRYLAKTQRNCSEFKVAQSWRRRWSAARWVVGRRRRTGRSAKLQRQLGSVGGRFGRPCRPWRPAKPAPWRGRDGGLDRKMALHGVFSRKEARCKPERSRGKDWTLP